MSETDDLSKDAAIASMRFQLDLSAGYIRDWANGRGPDKAFMVEFAAACDEVARRYEHIDTPGEYKDLLALEGWCRPFFNDQYATGEWNERMIPRMHAILSRLYFARHGNFDGLNWGAGPVGEE